MAQLLDISDVAEIDGNSIEFPDEATPEEMQQTINDLINAPKTGAMQLADSEFEVDVAAQTGPALAGVVDASKARMVQTATDYDPMKHSPILGAYLHGRGDVQAMKESNPQLDRDKMTMLQASMLDPEQVFEKGDVLGVGSAAFESSKYRIADTMAHEFIHKAAEDLDIPILKDELGIRAYTAFRATSPAQFDHSFDMLVDGFAEKLADKHKVSKWEVMPEAKEQALASISEGGMYYAPFVAMEEKMLKGSPHEGKSKEGANSRLIANIKGSKSAAYLEGKQQAKREKFAEEQRIINESEKVK